jgi:transcription antitermination factor NusG
MSYSGAVRFTEYGPGDVVYFPEGPFCGVCGVVREIDARRERMRIEFVEGLVHHEGNVLRQRRHSMTVEFTEVELV